MLSKKKGGSHSINNNKQCSSLDCVIYQVINLKKIKLSNSNDEKYTVHCLQNHKLLSNDDSKITKNQL